MTDLVCMYVCTCACYQVWVWCEEEGEGVERQVNGLMHLLFQEVEGRIEEVANSLKNSIKETDRGASLPNVSPLFAQCIHHSNPTSPLALPLCVLLCSPCCSSGGDTLQGQF